jgi:aryl-alcohol dehydrogenase-like predicted oxidoreductase
VFDAFQIPYSAAERDHEQVITDAAAAGAGTIVRGGVGGGEVERVDMPKAFRAAYRARSKRLAGVRFDDLLDGMSATEFMLRFTLSHPAMNTTIVGTSNPRHLAANVAAASSGPLAPEIYAEARRRFV